MGDRPPQSDALRQRLRKVKPCNAGKILSRDCYWSVEFLEPYLEKCDSVAFENPKDAYALAFHTPALADWIQVGERPGNYQREEEKRSYRVRARIVFASTCSRTGQMAEAQAQYNRVLELLKDGPVSRLDQADFLMRFAIFRTKSTVPGTEEPLVLLNRSLELLDGTSFNAHLASALVLRGNYFWRSRMSRKAAFDYAQAITSCAGSRGPRAERAVSAAQTNLLRLIAEDELYAMDKDQALAIVKQAKRRLGRYRSGIVGAKILWIEGTLYRRLGMAAQAERRLLRARSLFKKLGMPEGFVLVSLELGMIYSTSRQLLEYEVLRKETEETTRSMSSDQELLRSLETWQGETKEDGLGKVYRAVLACQDRSKV